MGNLVAAFDLPHERDAMILGLNRCIAELPKHGRVRPIGLQVNDPSGRLLEVNPDAQEKALRDKLYISPNEIGEALERLVPDGGWPRISATLWMKHPPLGNSLPDYEIDVDFHAVHVAERLSKGARPWEVFPTVPPFLAGRVLPLLLSCDIGATGGWIAFNTPTTKTKIESLWADLIHAVHPIRFAEAFAMEDWRAEQASPSMYYRDPLDMARSLKLLWGFRAPAKDIASVLVSHEFLDALPLWRKAPGPDGRIPERGLYLRRYWHPATMDVQRGPEDSSTDREPPDNSPSLLTLLTAALKAKRVRTARDPMRATRVSELKRMPPEAYTGAGEFAWD